MHHRAVRVFNPLAATSADPDVNAWLQTVHARGGTTSAVQKAVVQDFVGTLRDLDIWDRLDVCLLAAAENRVQATTDLKTALAFPETGPMDYVEGHGFVATEEGPQLNLLLNPWTTPLNYLPDAHMWSAWNIRNGDQPDNWSGFWLADRSAPDALDVYRNDVATGPTVTEPDPPVVDPAGGWYRAGPSMPEDDGTYCGLDLAAVIIGGTLTRAQRTALFDAVALYMRTFGVEP